MDTAFASFKLIYYSIFYVAQIRQRKKGKKLGTTGFDPEAKMRNWPKLFFILKN